MSRYLIDRIAATENIEVLYNTEVIALLGSDDSLLEQVRWKNRLGGEETERRIRNLVLFIGALAATDWLRSCGVTLDAKGLCRPAPILSPRIEREQSVGRHDAA
jgi:thioredoxin reductase (NADPH)